MGKPAACKGYTACKEQDCSILSDFGKSPQAAPCGKNSSMQRVSKRCAVQVLYINKDQDMQQYTAMRASLLHAEGVHRKYRAQLLRITNNQGSHALMTCSELHVSKIR